MRLGSFLASHSPPGASFSVDAVTYLQADKPDWFAVELSLKGDEGSIWRVEVEKGEPGHLTRDS
jgi:hypothetical protein